LSLLLKRTIFGGAYSISRTTICKWVMILQGIHNLPLTEKQAKYNTSSINSSKKTHLRTAQFNRCIAVKNYSIGEAA
jgi:hypothetical protein